MSTAIKRVDVFGYSLTYVHGDYVMSGGRTITALQSTVLRVTTGDGVEGFGETCPLGPAYLPAHAAGARAALRELAPAVLGLPVENLAAVNRALDAAPMGHGYAKNAIDIACWDAYGKTVGLPVYQLLGGPPERAIPTLRRGAARISRRHGRVRRRAARGGNPPLSAQSRS